jgi:hypothetical protein
MTLRARLILAVGLALVVATAAGSLVLAGGPAEAPPGAGPVVTAGVQHLSPAQWRTVQARLARRGFDRVTARIMGGSGLERPPLVLVVATPGGGKACYFAARGVRLGPATCIGRTSLVAFTLGVGVDTEVVAGAGNVGIVRFSLGDRTTCGLSFQPFRIWNGFSFEATFKLHDRLHQRFLRGYDAAGRIVALLELPLLSSSSTVRTTLARAAAPLGPKMHRPSGCTETSATAAGPIPVLDP